MLAPLQVTSAQLTASAAAYCTAGANARVTIQNATLCNTTGGAVTVTVYIVPSGAAAGVANEIFTRSIATLTTDRCPELVGKVLNENGSLQAKGASVTFDVSALIYTHA